jgi:hypothetical protein
MLTEKKCHGTGKGKGHGCGKIVPVHVKGRSNRIYGLGVSCECYPSWLYGSKEGKDKNSKSKINNRSKKRQAQELVYSKLRKVYLNRPENKICPIKGVPTTEVHHKKGRIGTLLIEIEFWVALSREGHDYVEDNPVWAKENGYSLNRN